MHLLRGWEVYNFVYGNKEKKHHHTAAAELDFRYQEHHCISLHVASLNLALSVPPGLALVCACRLGSEPRTEEENEMPWFIAHTSVWCLAVRAKDHFSSYVEERGNYTHNQKDVYLVGCGRVNELSHS